MDKLSSTFVSRWVGLIRSFSSKSWAQTFRAGGIVAIGCFTYSIVALAHGGDHHPASNMQPMGPHYHGAYWDPFWGGVVPGLCRSLRFKLFLHANPRPDRSREEAGAKLLCCNSESTTARRESVATSP